MVRITMATADKQADAGQNNIDNKDEAPNLFDPSDNAFYPDQEDQSKSLSWQASEFIHHQKNLRWYLEVMSAGVIVAAIIFLLTKDWISTAIVIVCALALCFYGSHKPRQLTYLLDQTGLKIDDKFFPLASFKAFFLEHQNGFSSLTFIPHKRFGLATTIHLQAKDEPGVMSIISAHLPQEPVPKDYVDSLMRRIRF